MKVDILAIGVHPDDVELGCSGTLINEIKRGKKVAIIDLTQGELGTRGTSETRYQEAANASMIMGVHARENLKMRDGFFENDEDHQLKLISAIRKYQPAIVIGNVLHDRHPDHGRANGQGEATRQARRCIPQPICWTLFPLDTIPSRNYFKHNHRWQCANSLTAT